MVARDRMLDNGLSALVAESDSVFLCTADPADWAAASGTHVGLKSGSRGSMFLAISSPPGGGRMASLFGFNDGAITSDGMANYIVIADSVNQTILITEPLVGAQQVSNGGLFAINAMDVILGRSAQPVAAGITVQSPQIGIPTFVPSGYALTVPDLAPSSPVFGAPTMIVIGSGWFNTPTAQEVGTFVCEFDAVPSAQALDCAIGLSDVIASNYSDMATIVLFTAGNILQARNGGAYAAQNAISYTAGISYHIRMVIDVSNHIYSVFVTPANTGIQVTLATNYAFRTEKATVINLDTFVIGTGAVGTVAISNLAVGTLSANSFATGSPSIPSPPLNNKVSIPAPTSFIDSSPVLDQPVLALGGGYNNLTNYPDGTNRPSVTASTLNFIAPVAGGASTTADTQQALVLSSSGALTLSTPNVTITGLDVTGAVNITANNVTLRRCRISSNATAVIDVANGVLGTVIEDCYIDGLGTQTFANGGFGIRAQSGTFRRNQIVRTGNSLAVLSGVGPTNFVDNYCWNMQSGGAPHYDQVQIDGGISNVTISHNTLINEQPQTSVIMIDNFAGAIDNILVDNNRLIGGGMPCYCDGSFSPFSAMTNIRYTNNRLGIGGVPGYTYFAIYPPTFTGNVDDVTGNPILASQIPLITGSFSIPLPAPNGTVVGNMTLNNCPAPAFCRTFLTDFNGVSIPDSSKFTITDSNVGTMAVNTTTLTAGTYRPCVQAWGPFGFTMTRATVVVGGTVKSFTATALTVSSPAIPQVALNNKVGMTAANLTVGSPPIGQPPLSLNGVGGYDNIANFPYSDNRPSVTGGNLIFYGSVNDTVNAGTGTSSTTSDALRTIPLTTLAGITTSSNGQVIEGKDITSHVQINHNNVTLRRCRIKFSAGSGGDQINILNTTTGFVCEDCEIDGLKTSAQGFRGSAVSGGIQWQGVIRRCNIHGHENSITGNPHDLLIEDNYIWGAGNSGNSSYDADMIEIYQSNNVTIRHNTFDILNSQLGSILLNSAINLSDLGNISNITIDNNHIMGGTWPHAVINDDSRFAGTITNWTFTNNGFINFSGPIRLNQSGSSLTSNSGNFTSTNRNATSGTPLNGNGQI